jgi:hypothetical protein
MSTVYGIEIAPKNDRYVDIAEKSIKLLLESLLPGAALCNTFPVREYESNRPCPMIHRFQTSIQSVAFQHGFLEQDSSGMRSTVGNSRMRC